MFTLSYGIHYDGRGRCKFYDYLSADECACDDADRAFDEENPSVRGDALVYIDVLGNMFAGSAQPGAEYDELSGSWLRRRVEECSRPYVDEPC